MTEVAQLVGMDALEALYTGEGANLRRYLRARSPNPEIADDLTSETFLAAGRAIHDGAELSGGWLMTVAKRRLVDFWRSKARDERIESTMRPRLSPGADHTLPISPELSSAFQALPVRQQQALGVRYLADGTVQQVADELAISYRAAEALLARGRRGLRAELDGRLAAASG